MAGYLMCCLLSEPQKNLFEFRFIRHGDSRFDVSGLRTGINRCYWQAVALAGRLPVTQSLSPSHLNHTGGMIHRQSHCSATVTSYTACSATGSLSGWHRDCQCCSGPVQIGTFKYQWQSTCIIRLQGREPPPSLDVSNFACHTGNLSNDSAAAASYPALYSESLGHWRWKLIFTRSHCPKQLPVKSPAACRTIS